MTAANTIPGEFDETPSIDKLVDLRVAHLGMIQATISRMSGYSATAKNFCVTVLAALIALSTQASGGRILIAATLLTSLLGMVDLYYLTLERRFRELYRMVSSREFSEIDLNITPDRNSPTHLAKALKSPSLLLFYVPILVACAVSFFVFTPVQSVQPAKPDTNATSAHNRT